MRVQVKQSGGYAGIPIDLADIDTATLAPADAHRLEQRVRDVGFFQLPATMDDSAAVVMADRARYEVTVEDGGRRHVVSFPEGAPGTEAVRELVTALQGG